jgi:hypothetical protein
VIVFAPALPKNERDREREGTNLFVEIYKNKVNV